ncbi:MAG: flagellar biosynthesis protein FlhF [Candidatus Aureabacteria bacterium]|nr:flagellar biosynthesis protein FlhF [Candidatus Auribacterota bacterium]
MKIKKYTGVSLESIFAKVKSDLGDKAVILSTKKLPDQTLLGLPKIVVTAALTSPVFEETVIPQKSIDEETCQKFLQALREKTVNPSATTLPEAGERTSMQSSSDQLNIHSEILEIKDILKSFCLKNAGAFDPRLLKIRDLLLSSHVEDDVAYILLEKLKTHLPSQPEVEIGKNVLIQTIGEMIKTKPLALDSRENDVFILLGTTGVGKTTTLAKLASIASLTHNRPVALVSFDSFRIGAHEHLQEYARILDAPFHGVSLRENLAQTVGSLRKNYTVFIDSSGISQYNKMKIRELGAVIREVTDAKKILLLCASTHPAESQKILKNFCSIIHIDGLIVTKCDEVEKPGQLLSLHRVTDIPLCHITDGQSIPEHIRPACGEHLAEKILYGKLP